MPRLCSFCVILEALQHRQRSVDSAKKVMTARGAAVLVMLKHRAEDGGVVKDAKQHKVELGVPRIDVVEEAVEGAHEPQAIVDAVAADPEFVRGRVCRHGPCQVRADGVEKHGQGLGVEMVPMQDNPRPLRVGALIGVFEGEVGGEFAHPRFNDALVLSDVGGTDDVFEKTEAARQVGDEFRLQLHVHERRRRVAFELEAGQPDLALGAVDDHGARQQGRYLPGKRRQRLPFDAARAGKHTNPRCRGCTKLFCASRGQTRTRAQRRALDGCLVAVSHGREMVPEGKLTQLLCFPDGGTQDVPALDKAGLGLVPVAGVQQGLNVQQVVVADGDDAVQLAGGIVVLCSKLLRRRAQVLLELSLQLGVSVLGGAGADHEEETSPLKAEGLAGRAHGPPVAVFLEEGGRVDDVVVVVDIVQEVLNERVWTRQRAKSRRRGRLAGSPV